MRAFIILLVSLGMTSGAAAQPKDGDLIISAGISMASGYLLSVEPTSGLNITLYTCNTLNIAVRTPRMGTRNTNIQYMDCQGIYAFDPIGKTSTVLMTCSGVRVGCGCELDHDNTWLIGAVNDWNLPYSNHLWSFDGTTVTTLHSFPFTNSSAHGLVELAIDRDPGSPPFVLGLYQSSTLHSTPKLLGVDRKGVISTIVSGKGDPLLALKDVELNPVTGDYLVCDENKLEISLVSKAGTVSNLPCTIASPAGVKFCQDGTAWIVSKAGVYRMDMAGTVITILPVVGSPFHMLTGIEIYGSRRLACNGPGKPGTAVQVRIQSRRAGDGGKPYALACSLSRRPGIKLPNGEWLNLDVTGALFMMTSQNLATTIFRNFQGMTDAGGNATAQVNIPGTIPSNLGFPVFVAGVVYDSAGIRSVTNTHWFVLQ